MNKLSKREKIMVYFCICFLISVGAFVLLLRPTFQQLQKEEDKREKYETKQADMQLALAECEATKVVFEEKQAELDTYRNELYSYLTNDEADKLITKYCKQHQLKPVEMAISNLADTSELMPPQEEEEEEPEENRQLAADADAADEALMYAGQSVNLQSLAETLASDDAKMGVVRCKNVTVTVEGSYDSFCELLDSLQTEKALTVTDYVVNTTPTGVLASITFAIYMI